MQTDSRRERWTGQQQAFRSLADGHSPSRRGGRRTQLRRIERRGKRRRQILSSRSGNEIHRDAARPNSSRPCHIQELEGDGAGPGINGHPVSAGHQIGVPDQDVDAPSDWLRDDRNHLTAEIDSKVDVCGDSAVVTVAIGVPQVAIDTDSVEIVSERVGEAIRDLIGERTQSSKTCGLDDVIGGSQSAICTSPGNADPSVNRGGVNRGARAECEDEFAWGVGPQLTTGQKATGVRSDRHQ